MSEKAHNEPEKFLEQNDKIESGFIFEGAPHASNMLPRVIDAIGTLGNGVASVEKMDFPKPASSRGKIVLARNEAVLPEPDWKWTIRLKDGSQVYASIVSDDVKGEDYMSPEQEQTAGNIQRINSKQAEQAFNFSGHGSLFSSVFSVARAIIRDNTPQTPLFCKQQITSLVKNLSNLNAGELKSGDQYRVQVDMDTVSKNKNGKKYYTMNYKIVFGEKTISTGDMDIVVSVEQTPPPAMEIFNRCRAWMKGLWQNNSGKKSEGLVLNTEQKL